MITATCHCGAIRVHVRRAPRILTSGNCSICRRYGALWAYYSPKSVDIECARDALSSYSWNRKVRNYFRCRNCGCVTHYAYRKKRPWTPIAVNAANFDLKVTGAVRIRKLDGASTWKFLD